MYNEFFYIDRNWQISTSTLYDIEPIGLGSIYCESITSFLVRLSELHLIKPGDLINKVLAPKLKKEYLINSATFGGNRFYDGAKALNGVSENSMDLVNVLELLTSHRGLINLTLLKWDKVFTSRGLLKSSLSWCPRCLEEFKTKWGYYYYPLIWFIKPIRSCTKHNNWLISECSSCMKVVPVLHRSSINGLCPYCNEELSNSQTTQIPDSDMEKENYIVENISKLIAFSENLEYKLNKDIICSKLSHIDEYYRKECQKSLLEILDVPKATYYYWLRGESIPTLQTITNICYSVGVSLFSFFFDNTLNPSITTKKIIRDNVAIERKTIDYFQLEKTLRTYFHKDIPMSMVAIAVDINVNKRTLYKAFPDICKELSKKYQDYTKLKSSERKNEVIQLINKSVKELSEQGISTSQKNIENYLSANALIRENFAKEYLKEMIETFD